MILTLKEATKAYQGFDLDVHVFGSESEFSDRRSSAKSPQGAGQKGTRSRIRIRKLDQSKVVPQIIHTLAPRLCKLVKLWSRGEERRGASVTVFDKGTGVHNSLKVGTYT
jgi:hypothetical protein